VNDNDALNTAISHHQAGRLGLAESGYRSALAREPANLAALQMLGRALLQMNRAADAVPSLQSAVALNPQSPDAVHALAHAMLLCGRTDEAIAYFQRALEIEPSAAGNYCNLANAYATRLDLNKALAAVNRALFLRPDFPDAHWNKAMILLVQGNLDEGFIEHEWRWIKFAQHRRNFTQPLWDGSPIAGKTILLHAEQGAGDTIQFVRYATDVARTGARVLLETQPSLASLLSRIEGVEQVVPRGHAFPQFDVHCPLLSLPFVLGLNSIEAIAGTNAYVRPPDQIVSRWAELLKPYAAARKVGIVWAGDPGQGRDFERSATPQVLLPLGRMPGIKLFSLQKSPPGQSSAWPHGLDLIDFTSRLHDFSETAGLIANLDLVISVDTSVAHLAGAMGKPVWTMLAHHADWRWFLERSDSPWYPSMRLFRQAAARDWESVVQMMLALIHEELLT
jgi:tetratricopeptide (TPR) repeat protein